MKIILLKCSNFILRAMKVFELKESLQPWTVNMPRGKTWNSNIYAFLWDTLHGPLIESESNPNLKHCKRLLAICLKMSADKCLSFGLFLWWKFLCKLH